MSSLGRNPKEGARRPPPLVVERGGPGGERVETLSLWGFLGGHGGPFFGRKEWPPRFTQCKERKSPPILLPPLGIPLAGGSIDPLIPQPGIDTMPDPNRNKLISPPAGIVPAKVLAGLAGLFLTVHFIASSQIKYNKNKLKVVKMRAFRSYFDIYLTSAWRKKNLFRLTSPSYYDSIKFQAAGKSIKLW